MDGFGKRITGGRNDKFLVPLKANKGERTGSVLNELIELTLVFLAAVVVDAGFNGPVFGIAVWLFVEVKGAILD